MISGIILSSVNILERKEMDEIVSEVSGSMDLGVIELSLHQLYLNGNNVY
jgi:hypothetical protein